METAIIILSVVLVAMFGIIAYQRYTINDLNVFSNMKDEEIEKTRDDLAYSLKVLEANKKLLKDSQRISTDLKVKLADANDAVKKLTNDYDCMVVKYDELKTKHRSAVAKAAVFEKKLSDVLQKLEAKIKDEETKKKVSKKKSAQ